MSGGLESHPRPDFVEQLSPTCRGFSSSASLASEYLGKRLVDHEGMYFARKGSPINTQVRSGKRNLGLNVITASLCGAERCIYASVGFETEGAEGQLCHAEALQRMAEPIAADASLGVGAILRNTASGRDFLAAVDFIFGQMSPVRRSTMVSSLVASINGAFGHTLVHPKPEERPPWLSPLTSLVWYFEADAVAKNKLFYEEALLAKSLSELSHAIKAKRQEVGVQARSSIKI